MSSHYYPKQLPFIKKENLNKYKIYSKPSTLLYSDEGLYQVKDAKLYQVHFNDDLDDEIIKIGNIEFVCDNSKIIWSSVNKLPYNFKRRDILVTCYELGSVKMYIEEENNICKHVYFFVKDKNIYGIENDISYLIQCAKS